MSQQIDQNFVDQFSANVMMLAQQKGSRLRPYVRNEMVRAESAFFDRIGPVNPVVKAGRHSNTPQLDTPHSRRMLTLTDYEWADLIDDQDKIRSLNDPTNEYVMAAMWSLGRAIDDEIIEAALGTAQAGKKGQTAVPFPLGQYFAANNGSAGINMNVATLRAMNKKFQQADVPDDQPKYIAVTSSQVESLLADNTLTSSDFNTVKALVGGQVNYFMGFTFIRTERLPVVQAAEGLAATFSSGVVASGSSNTTGFRKCFAWTQPGLILGVGADMKAKISERDDKSYSTQAYAMMSVGAVRMEEVQVVAALCNEA